MDGVLVRPAAEPTYLLLNKPAGVVSTMRDPARRPTLARFVPRGGGLFPVGRLDFDTSGAILFTDDGELAHRLLHPRYGVEKTYRVTIRGALTPQEAQELRLGIDLGDGRTAPAKVRVLTARGERSVVEITLHEGRNRQVRRMFAAVGHRVQQLTRTRFGPVLLGGLGAGRVRPLSAKERAALGRHGSGRGNKMSEVRNKAR